ncbi:MAG: CvpA family protein [Candidatus Nitrohelix vancouverensis]|uniref:CvpA family protein n=1 Tax=Candidatus Nitrohelix vancouverensis TaxID=2705534 RepID=A0A7T0C3M7_9BACT|nr:MAG: CvpA family protein [Candidatus Nitrohelix vancouverensis]
MTPFDTIVAIVLTLSLLYSIFKGFVREIFSLLAYVGGYLTALKFQYDFASVLEDSLGNETVAKVVAFILIYFGAAVAISFVGRMVRNLLFQESAGLSGMDRLLGGAVGLVKGFVLLSILMIPLGFFPDFHSKITAGSKFEPYLAEVAQIMKNTVGASQSLMDKIPDMGEAAGDSINGLKEKFKELQSLVGAMDSKSAESGQSGSGKDQMNSLAGNLEGAKELLGKPQEKYTEDDMKKLDELLKKLDQKK